MKKIICLLVALSFLLVSFASCVANEDKKLAKEVFLIVDSPLEINNCQQMYEQLNQFLSSEKCDEIISEYYDSIFGEDSPQQAYASVYGSYDASLLHLGKFEEFKNSVEQNSSKYYGEQYSYSRTLWMSLLVTPKDVHGVDSISIQKVFSEISFDDSDVQQHWNTILYYWNLYWGLEISEELKNEVVHLRLYESYRMGYIASFLMCNKHEDFNRLFVQEYQNDPFTGTDIMYLIQQEVLTEEQLTTLDNSLESLEEAYLTNRPNIYPLKKEIIDNLQTTIKNNK